MKERFLRSPYWWTGGIVLLLALVQLGWVFSQMHSGPRDSWAVESFAGRASFVSGDGITVVDARGQSRTYTIATSTRVVRGRDDISMSDITVGTFVIISDGDGSTAREVRVMTERFDRGDHPRP